MPDFSFKPHELMAPVLVCSMLLPATALGLTLAEAEQRAISHNPALTASEAAADAADGDARQAGLPANPEVGFSRENMGNDRLTGLDGPASTWQLSQKLDLTGQRGARRASALGEAEAARSRLLRERELLRADVRSTWVDVVAAQQRVTFADELGRVTTSTRDAVAAQVKAGKVSPIELTRVEVAAAALQRRAQIVRLSLGAARQRLANLQGLASPDFGALPDVVPEALPLPTEDDVRQRVPSSLWVHEAEARTKASEASLRAAKAARLSGVTVSVGQTQFERAGESAWQMGVSVPLPLFDRNQGAVQAAEARVRQARAQTETTSQGLRTELEVLYPQVRTLEQQLNTFRQSVLPASEEAFSAVNKGYRFGKFGLLDVLDAQRALIDTRFDYLDTLTEYHRQRNRLYALLGLTQESPL